MTIRIVQDLDCPECAWPELIAVGESIATGPQRLECSKCEWTGPVKLEDSCRSCDNDIEYVEGNEPPWCHTETGFSDCLDPETGEPDGFHAEPRGS